MFNDPNDLASLAAVTCVISIYFLTDPTMAGVRYLWLLPIGLMTHAVLMTHSRGGILAFGVACMAWMAVKYGGKVAMAIGAMGAAAVPVVLGRQGNMEISGGTGQQRIQLWADGLAQIKIDAAAVRDRRKPLSARSPDSRPTTPTSTPTSNSASSAARCSSAASCLRPGRSTA